MLVIYGCVTNDARKYWLQTVGTDCPAVSESRIWKEVSSRAVLAPHIVIFRL